MPRKSPLKRGEVVDRFNSDGSVACMLLTTGVGGVGLNLTAADTVVFFEPDWNPMVDLQAMDRAHRIGQKRAVNVYRLITDNTLEEYMMDVQMFKTKLANDVLAGVKRGSLDESAKDSGAVPSGATRIGQILTGGATREQQGNATSEDEEYNLHAVESFIQSLNT